MEYFGLLVLMTLSAVSYLCEATLKDNLKHYEIISSSDLSHGRMKRDSGKRTPVHPAGIPVKELSFKVR